MNKAVDSITSFMIQKGVFSEDDREVYNYCFELLLSNLLNILATLLLAIIAGRLMETGLFLVGFLLLRRTAGGYHAQTHWGCFLLWTSFICGFLTVLTFLPRPYIPFLLVGCILLSLLTVFLLAPIEHENKPISKDDLRKFKRNSRAIVSALALGTIFTACVYPASMYRSHLCSLGLGMLTISLSLMMANYSAKKKKGGEQCGVS